MKMKRILVIDDEASVTRSIKLGLETLGAYEVRAENHAPAGVRAAREFRPDLVLLDIMMAEMDGGDVARHLRSDPSLQDTPIVFLTALVTNRETRGHEVNIHNWSYLAKPVDLAELARVIETHLRVQGDTGLHDEQA